MSLGDLGRLLSHGQRKELGNAAKVSAALVSGELAMADLLKVLEAPADQEVIVSHGMHALRTAVEGDRVACRKAIRWLLPRLDRFPQWEAREQFCRMLIAHPPKISAQLWSTLARCFESDKAIVSAYALEAKVVLANSDGSRRREVDALIAGALHHEKAAVRARARKLDRDRG